MFRCFSGLWLGAGDGEGAGIDLHAHQGNGLGTLGVVEVLLADDGIGALGHLLLGEQLRLLSQSNKQYHPWRTFKTFPIFASMNNEETLSQVNQILEDPNAEAQLESLWMRIDDAIRTDDEPFDRKARQLLLAYVANPKLTDDILMTLTGYQLSSLL